MSKRYRQGQILNLIRGHSIHTQEELAAELTRQGVQATQVTLSRDLRELGLVKTTGGYREMKREEPDAGIEGLFREFVTDVRIAQNLIVLRTDPGHASPVAVALDSQEWPEIVGTIAGDDTILVIAADTKTAEQARLRLLALLS